MSIVSLTPADEAVLAALAATYPFKPYRHYRVLSRAAQAAVLQAELNETLHHPLGLGLTTADGSSAVLGRGLDWDSEFFGVPMGRLEYVFATENDAARRVLRTAVDTFAERGVRHLSARVDVGDVLVLRALEDLEFRIVDALVTYTTRPRKEPPRAVREVGIIRPFRVDDGEALLEIATQAYRGFRGRFHLDGALPRERCDAFYSEWARQCISGAMAHTILVSEGAQGQLIGFLAFRTREPVSSVGGVTVYGGGLGACRSEQPGAYAGLIRAGTLWAHERDGVAECQTQNYNFPTVRIYEAVGAHYVRAEYTLHRWIR